MATAKKKPTSTTAAAPKKSSATRPAPALAQKLCSDPTCINPVEKPGLCSSCQAKAASPQLPKPKKSRSKHPEGIQRLLPALPAVNGKICPTCGKPLSKNLVIANHHAQFCDPTRHVNSGRGAGRVSDRERLATELNVLDAKFPNALDDYVPLRKQRPAPDTRKIYFKLAVMSASERAQLLSELASRHSINMLAAELSVTDKTLRNWLKPLALIRVVQDALDVGERGGLSMNKIGRFFLPGKGPYLSSAPREPEEQLRLLEILRGQGRARGQKL